MWQEALCRERVVATDDFFELGGDSLALTSVLERVHQQYNCEPSLVQFLQLPTLEAMVDLIRTAQPSSGAYSPVIPLQPSGLDAPLFVIPGIQGRVLNYLEMMHRFNFGHPLLALRPPGFETGERALRSIETLAAVFARAMRERWPKGPLLIAGYSFGGIVAFETARQFWESGDRSAKLIIFDTANGLPTSGDEEGLPHVPLDVIPSDQQIDQAVHALRALKRLPKRLDLLAPEVRRRWLRARHCHLYALSVYRARRYPGTLYLVRAVRHSDTEPVDEDLGWRAVTGNIETADVEATHESMLRVPAIDQVMTHLRAWIRES
jgi:thioesterase domain-containing protein/acyl carrier protein